MIDKQNIIVLHFLDFCHLVMSKLLDVHIEHTPPRQCQTGWSSSKACKTDTPTHPPPPPPPHTHVPSEKQSDYWTKFELKFNAEMEVNGKSGWIWTYNNLNTKQYFDQIPGHLCKSAEVTVSAVSNLGSRSDFWALSSCFETAYPYCHSATTRENQPLGLPIVFRCDGFDQQLGHSNHEYDWL